MAASDVRAGRAYVELGANTSALEKGLNKAAGLVKNFASVVSSLGQSMTAIGSAVIAPLTAASAVFAEMGNAMSKASQRVGINVEQLSTLGYAAQQSGTSLESLEKGLQKMSKVMEGAAEGSAESVAALERIGVTMADLNKLSPEDRLKAVATAISKVADVGQRGALEMQIFGKAAADLLPLLNQGAHGINALQERARALGLQMSGADAVAAEVFNQKIKDLWDVLQRGVFLIGSAVAPAIQRATEIMTTIAVATNQWIENNKQLFVSILEIAGVVAAVGAGITVLGVVIAGAGATLLAVSAIVGGIGAVLAALPFVAVVAGVAGIVSAFIYFSGIGTSVVNHIIDAFHKVWDSLKFVFENTSTLSEAWGAIIAEAGFFVQGVWLSAKGIILNAWAGVRGFFGGLFRDINIGILKATNATTTAFLKAWQYALRGWAWYTQTYAGLVHAAMDPSMKKLLDADLQKIDGMEKAGQLSHEMAEQSRRTAHTDYDGYDRKQQDAQANESDAKLAAALSAIQQEYEAKRTAIEELQKIEKSADDKSNQAEKEASAKSIAIAKAELAEKKRAYEEALKAKHAASGEKSLFQQSQDLLFSIQNIKIPIAVKGDPTAGFVASERKASVVGSFNPYAFAGRGEKGDQGRIVKNGEESNRLLKQIKDAIVAGASAGFSII